MVVIQVPMEISEATYAGLLAGVYKRTGGVVRDNGKIVEHLKDSLISEQSYGHGGLRIVDFLKNNKYIAIGLGVATVAAVGAIALYAMNSSKSKKSAKLKIPKCVEDYNASLCAYLEAVRNGNLDIDTINCLISDLDNIKVNYDGSRITIDFSAEQLDTLVNLVFDYTKKLAEANSVELNEFTESASVSADNAIIDLQRCLKVQKQIFEKAS